MTNEEKEIGAKWLAILNAYSSDFSTKALFNQTATYLKAKHNGGKRVSKFQREVKVDNTILTENVKPEPKKVSLLEAKKIREQQELEDEDLDGNLLAIDETEEYNEVKKTRKTRKNV